MDIDALTFSVTYSCTLISLTPNRKNVCLVKLYFIFKNYTINNTFLYCTGTVDVNLNAT